MGRTEGSRLRNLIIALSLAAATVSLGIAYETSAAVQVNRMTYAPAAIASPFAIPVSPNFSTPWSGHRFLPLLTQAAQQFHVNVFRTSLGDTSRGVPNIIQFVLLTGRTRLYSAFRLANGHWLSPAETLTSNDFLSTAATGNLSQVGRLAKIGGAPTVEIRPLREADQWLFLPGQYWVEASSALVKNQFLSAFANSVNRSLKLGGSSSYSAWSFVQQVTTFVKPPAAFGVPAYALNNLLGALRIGLAGVLGVVLLFASVSRARRMAVMRIGGLSSARIWWSLAGAFILIVSVSSLGVVVGMSELLGRGSPGFLYRAVLADALSCGVLLVASTVVWFYAARMQVVQGLKGRTRTGIILVLNLLIKATILATATLMSLAWWTNAANTYHEINLLKTEHVQTPAFYRYGLLTASIGHDYLGIAQGSLNTTYVRGTWLYPYLVRRGALLIDASEYEHPSPLSQSGSYLQTLTVNRSYLAAFHVWTPAHTRVKISETSAWVVLVPMSDRPETGRIRAEISQERRQFDLASPFPVPSPIRNQPIRIVWIADQSLQTLDPLISPNHDSMVRNPIVQVVTLQNSTAFDRGPSFGGVGDPLKLPIGSSTANTYAAIVPELRSLHLADQLSGLKTIPSAETAFLAIARSALFIQVAIALGSLIAGVFLALACLRIIFARYNRRVLVRRLFGLGILRAYREWGATVALTILVELAICIVVLAAQAANSPPGTPTSLGINVIRVIAIAVAFAVIELGVSALKIRRTERKILAIGLKEGV